MSEETKYHTFQRGEVKLKDVLTLIRSSGYSNRDEGSEIILKLECEEWTWVKINENSGLLDLLGDMIVESLDADDDCICLWIKSDDYNWFDRGKQEE